MLDATPILRLYSNHRLSKLAKQDIAKVQERTLLNLVHKASSTRFGKDHNYNQITSVSEFQNRVPLRYYEKLWDDYWKKSFPNLQDITWPGKIPYFAVSSGTSSGTTKYLPYTNEMTASNKKAGLDLLVHHLANRPKSKIFGGKSFMLGGSTDLVEQASGVYSGDLSGIAVNTFPWWARLRYFPPPDLALLKDWEKKIALLAERSLGEDIRMLSGVPSWLLIFFDMLSKLRPESEGKISRLYPKLEMLVHGGVNFAPYKLAFLNLLEGSQAELREVYPASEGFIALADRGYGEGLRVVLDHGIFFEFVPLDELDSPNPTRHWIHNIECGVNYALVMSTCAGLWAYIIGDTVKFIEKNPPRLLVTGRTSYYLSAFGEHLIAEEVEDAVSWGCAQVECSVRDYSVGPLYPQKAGDLGGHLFVIEFLEKVPNKQVLEELPKLIEKRLCQRNEDYEAHRANGYGLKGPQVLLAKSGMFAAWMKSRGKLGGQNKVPRIIMNQDLFNNLLEFCEHYHD